MNVPKLPNSSHPNFLPLVEQLLKIREGTTEERFVTFKDLYDKDFINSLAVYETPITSSGGDNLVGDRTAPALPTSVTITAQAFGNLITWVNPVDSDLYYIEVWASSVTAGAAAPAVSTASHIAVVTQYPVAVQLFDHRNIDLTKDYYYWVRAVDFYGNPSTWGTGNKTVGLSVAATIDKIMDMLKGADPANYDNGATYNVGNQVHYTTDGRNYICHTGVDISGIVPTTTANWKRHGVLLTGNVDGVEVVGVDGNMVVDGTIYARSLIVTELSAITADIGDITAGTLSSSDYAAAAGIRIDLDNKWLKMGGSNVTYAGAAAGIFLGYEATATAGYKLYIGDGSSEFIKYNPSEGLQLSSAKATAITILGGGDITLTGGETPGKLILTDGADTGVEMYMTAASAFYLKNVHTDGSLYIVNEGSGPFYIDHKNANDQIVFRGGTTPTDMFSLSVVGASFSGSVAIADLKNLNIGAEQDLFILHNTSDSYLQNKTGNLYIRNTSVSNLNLEQKNASGSIILATGATPTTAVTIDSSQVATFTANIVAPTASFGGSTHKTTFEADGTMLMNGNATVWKDANIGGVTLGGPAADLPDEVKFTDEAGADTGIYTWGFAVGEKVHGCLEIPHGYKEGSDITFHVHWQGKAAPAGGTDNVQWQCTYTVAQRGETLDAVAVIKAESAITVQYDSILTSFTAITGTNFNIGDQFIFILERIAASADEYGGDALLETVGIHYESDTIGSRSILSK